MSEEESPTFTIIIKASNDKRYNIAVSESTTIAELKQQLATQAEVPVERQRLIFTGRILKDPDTVGFYKIKDGNTIHLVKTPGPPSTNNNSTSTSNSAASTNSSPNSNTSTIPTNIAAGQGTGNLLADLTGARFAGLANLPPASMFGADGGMGPAGNLEDLANLLETPGFRENMLMALNNPQMIDMMINSSPHMRESAPQIRQMLQSPQFREMITNPQFMRQMLQMQQMFGLGNTGGGGASSFPAPGAPTTNPNETDTSSTSSTVNTDSASTGVGAGTNPMENPFAALLRNSGGAGAGAAGGLPAFNPALFSGLFGGGANTGSPEPADSRPPEERYEAQLRQLNELGFYDFDRNVRALRRSGGNVQGAVEALLDGQV